MRSTIIIVIVVETSPMRTTTIVFVDPSATITLATITGLIVSTRKLIPNLLCHDCEFVLTLDIHDRFFASRPHLSYNLVKVLARTDDARRTRFITVKPISLLIARHPNVSSRLDIQKVRTTSSSPSHHNT
jgi:hypothetical protein